MVVRMIWQSKGHGCANMLLRLSDQTDLAVFARGIARIVVQLLADRV